MDGWLNTENPNYVIIYRKVDGNEVIVDRSGPYRDIPGAEFATPVKKSSVVVNDSSLEGVELFHRYVNHGTSVEHANELISQLGTIGYDVIPRLEKRSAVLETHISLNREDSVLGIIAVNEMGKCRYSETDQDGVILTDKEPLEYSDTDSCFENTKVMLERKFPN